MMLWDCRGFYADGRLTADAEPPRWAELIGEHPTVSETAERLRQAGFTHLLFGVRSADFFAQHDPRGEQGRAIEYFINEFQPACARLVRQDAGAVLYELTCP